MVSAKYIYGANMYLTKSTCLNLTEVTTQLTFLLSSKPVKGADCFYCAYINYSEIKASERSGCLNTFTKQKLLFAVSSYAFCFQLSLTLTC